MKKLFMAAVAVLSLVACTSKAQYVVEGTSSAEGTTVYLHELLGGELLGETQVTDGHFSFTGKQDKDALLIVSTYEELAPSFRFFNDGQKVTIDVDSNTLCGSDLNQKLSDYDAGLNGLETKMIETYVEMQGVEDEAKLAEMIPAFQAVQEEFVAYPQNILQDNPDNIIPAAYMEYLVYIMDPEDLVEAMDSKAPYMKHPLVKKALADSEERAKEQQEADEIKNDIIGKEFTDFEMPDEDGNIHTLSQFVGRGNWVLVDFWASWCGPCRGEMPNVVKAYNEYHDKGFEIVGISFDNDKDAWLKAIKDLEMPWIHLSDLAGWNSVAVELYGVNAIPDNLLIDPDGFIVARGLRGAALGRKLEEIFK
ncbi:MAG: AhpC/TSA family protein [Bacteroidales bacterium]|nr:AhpC/TSA family protein [Bacteroidales bacterium]